MSECTENGMSPTDGSTKCRLFCNSLGTYGIDYSRKCIFFYFSDILVQLDGQVLKAHRFVLLARGDDWCDDDISTVTSLDFSGKILLFLWWYM